MKRLGFGLVATAASVVFLVFASPAAAQEVEVELDPGRVRPNGSVQIVATCGRADSATADISSFGGGASGSLRMQMGDSPDGVFSVQVTAPPRPGSFEVDVNCSNGNSGSAWLDVATRADTGATGSTAADSTDSTAEAGPGDGQPAGLVALVLAAAGGLLLHRRRAART